MAKKLDVLRKIIQEVNASDDLLQALRQVVHRVRQAITTDACSIYLYNPDSEAYWLCASEGFANDGQTDLFLKKDQGLVGLIGRREEPLNLESAQQHPKYSYFPETGEEQYQSFLGAPIIHRRKVLGVLVVQQKLSRRFDEKEEAFLVTVSAQLASVIAHAEASEEEWHTLRSTGQVESKQRRLKGLPVAPGVNMGCVKVVYPAANLDAVPKRKTTEPDKEWRCFLSALEEAREELHALANTLTDTLPKEELALFEAYVHMLDDITLADEVRAHIYDGWAAQTALKRVIRRHAHVFEEMDDEYLRDRAYDIKDLGARLLKHLQKNKEQVTSYPDEMLLVGEEITATLLAEVPTKSLRGIVSVRGSKNSHVAVLARALGVPVVMGVDGLHLDSASEKVAIIDGYNGHVYLQPDEALKEEFSRLIEEDKALYAGLSELRNEVAETIDGCRVNLYANIGLSVEAASALEVGAEGVGLYRTEMTFMVRESFPTEKEQQQQYRTVLESFHPKPVTMRTLDVGGDKRLPYFPVEEENPYLGWRGIRLTLDHPELLLVQLRAMMLASEGLDNLSLMLPMISSVSEVRDVKAFIDQAYTELCEEGVKLVYPKLGAMIEVPSAIFQIGHIASYVDFLSVGTNDLTQYLLAVDRNNERVAYLYETLHPAVLNALVEIVRQAEKAEIKVGACGEMASDPAGVLMLLALGYNDLSMNPSSLPMVKWVIRSVSQDNARQLLSEVMTMDTAEAVRAHLQRALDAAGLGGLIRAGR